MKKYILTIIIFLFVASSYAQLSALFRMGSKSARAYRHSSKVAKSTYHVPKRLYKTHDYFPNSFLEIKPTHAKNYHYPNNFYEYAKINKAKSGDGIHDAMREYSNKRIENTQQILKEEGYLKTYYPEVWDHECNVALNKYFDDFEEELSSLGSSDLRIKLIKDYNSKIPHELMTRSYANMKFVADSKTKIQVAKMQYNLKNTGYYKGEVDGLYGPLTKKAINNFERDFHFSNIPYSAKFQNEKNISYIEIEDADDFAKYWKKASKQNKNECEPNLCFSSEQITIELTCGNTSLIISSKGSLTLNVQNNNQTYSFDYIDNELNSLYNNDWELCISPTAVSGEIVMGELSISANSLREISLISTNSGRSRSVSLHP